MKRRKMIFGLVMIALIASALSAQADEFSISGPGLQVVEHILPAQDSVSPGDTIEITIVNGSTCASGSPKYDAFAVYLVGEEVVVGAAFREASACPRNVCSLTVKNYSTSIAADEFYVVAAYGKSPNTSACVSHD